MHRNKSDILLDFTSLSMVISTLNLTAFQKEMKWMGSNWKHGISQLNRKRLSHIGIFGRLTHTKRLELRHRQHIEAWLTAAILCLFITLLPFIIMSCSKWHVVVTLSCCGSEIQAATCGDCAFIGDVPSYNRNSRTDLWTNWQQVSMA